MSVAPRDIVVAPARMLDVTIEQKPKGGDKLGRFFPEFKTVAAITCGYVVADNPDGSLAIALDVVYDPGNTHPTSTYLCPAERLVCEVLAPRRVLKVSPYRY